MCAYINVRNVIKIKKTCDQTSNTSPRGQTPTDVPDVITTYHDGTLRQRFRTTEKRMDQGHASEETGRSVVMWIV